MTKTLINIGYYALIAGICAVGLLVLSSIMPIPGNIAVKVVKSGSMEPAIPVGSVVVTKPAESYAVGDIVTFGADTKTQVPTTHRVVGTEGSGAAQTFSTQGDANNAPDQVAVKPSDIHGKVVLTIPYLGFILAFAKTQLGFILLVAIPALLVCVEEVMKIFIEVRRIWKQKRSEHDEHPPARSQLPAPKKERRGFPARIVEAFKATRATRRSEVRTFRSRPSIRVSPYVMDLRLPTQAGRITYVDPPADPVVPEEPDRELRKRQSLGFGSLGTASAVVLLVCSGIFSRNSGDTIAFYMSTETASGNSLTAAAEYPEVTETFSQEAVSLFLSLLSDPATSTEEEETTSEITVEEESQTPESPPESAPQIPEEPKAPIVDGLVEYVQEGTEGPPDLPAQAGNEDSTVDSTIENDLAPEANPPAENTVLSEAPAENTAPEE